MGVDQLSQGCLVSPRSGTPVKLLEERTQVCFAPIFVSCSYQKPQVGAGGQSGQSGQIETVSLGNEDINESGSTSSGAADIDSIISQRIVQGSSKWQLKRKRNTRHTSKNKTLDSRKSVDVDDESNSYLAGSESLKVDREVDEYWGWNGNISRKAPQTTKIFLDCSLTAQGPLLYRQS